MTYYWQVGATDAGTTDATAAGGASSALAGARTQPSDGGATPADRPGDVADEATALNCTGGSPFVPAA